MISRPLAAIVAAIVALCVAAAIAATWRALLTAGAQTLAALWTLPALLALHALQLLLSSLAWRGLVAIGRPGIALTLRLRTAREGINTLLPVAHVGGDILIARLLTRRGLAGGTGGASVVADVTTEVLAQALFLAAGLSALAALSGVGTATVWAGIVALAAASAGGFLAAQRFGALRLLDKVIDELGRRVREPGVDAPRLHDAAMAIYAARIPVVAACLLHFASWSLGTIETWLVLHAIGVPCSWAAALVIESLGMAARSAGFAIPAAIAVQEGGFVLAAATVGVAAVPALSLALVKRVREVLTALFGLMLWRLEAATILPADRQ